MRFSLLFWPLCWIPEFQDRERERETEREREITSGNLPLSEVPLSEYSDGVPEKSGRILERIQRIGESGMGTPHAYAYQQKKIQANIRLFMFSIVSACHSGSEKVRRLFWTPFWLLLTALRICFVLFVLFSSTCFSKCFLMDFGAQLRGPERREF